MYVFQTEYLGIIRGKEKIKFGGATPTPGILKSRKKYCAEHLHLLRARMVLIMITNGRNGGVTDSSSAVDKYIKYIYIIRCQTNSSTAHMKYYLVVNPMQPGECNTKLQLLPLVNCSGKGYGETCLGG